MSDKKEILNIDQFLKLLKENKKDKSIKIDDNYFLFKQPLPVYTHVQLVFQIIYIWLIPFIFQIVNSDINIV
jgi:hypothetical protein